MTRPMVAQVLTRLNVGGPARMALAAQAEFPSLGVESVVIAGSVQEGEADLAELLGVRDVIHVPALGRRLSPADDPRAFGSLVRLLRRLRPGIVHTHMAKAGALGRAAAIAAGVPVRVHTFHGHTLHDYWSPAGERAVVLAERALARGTTELLAVSEQVRADLLARGIGTPDRFRVVMPGLDLRALLGTRPGDGELRAELGIPADAPVVGFAGRLVPVKGVDVFLAALEPMLSARPDLHMVVAGDGGERPLVERAAARHATLHRLDWIDDMTSFYAAVDVVVLSSRNEGTPLSLIEAAAAGVPVVATAVGGVPDVVEADRTGILVPPERPDLLGEAVVRLLGDPDLRRDLGDRARSHAERFSAARYAGELAARYRTLLAGRRVGAAA